MSSKPKKNLGLLSIILLVLSISSITTMGQATLAHASTLTDIYVDPSDYVFDASTTHVGTLFNVTVRVKGVADMKTWQIKMWFNDTFVNATRWFEPKDSTYVFYGKTTLPVPAPPRTAYGRGGWVGMGSSLFPAPAVGEGFTGDGTLCKIEFNITAIPPPSQTYSCALNVTNYPDTFWIKAGGSAKTSYDKYENGYYEIQGPAAPRPPTANFTWTPEFPQAGRAVSFNASSSSPNGGEIVKYDWNFGDGTPSSAGVTVTHTYAAEGTYDVTLNVTDSEGLWNSTLKPITVQPRPSYRSTDISGNGKVDMEDISLAIVAFLAYPSHPRWDERCDIDYDNSVDMMDIALVMEDFYPA
jgi:PKD repeat protein